MKSTVIISAFLFLIVGSKPKLEGVYSAENIVSTYLLAKKNKMKEDFLYKPVELILNEDSTFNLSFKEQIGINSVHDILTKKVKGNWSYYQDTIELNSTFGIEDFIEITEAYDSTINQGFIKVEYERKNGGYENVSGTITFSSGFSLTNLGLKEVFFVQKKKITSFKTTLFPIFTSRDYTIKDNTSNSFVIHTYSSKLGENDYLKKYKLLVKGKKLIPLVNKRPLELKSAFKKN